MGSGEAAQNRAQVQGISGRAGTSRSRKVRVAHQLYSTVQTHRRTNSNESETQCSLSPQYFAGDSFRSRNLDFVDELA